MNKATNPLPLPSLEVLQSCFIYNPTTGEMTNKQSGYKFKKIKYSRLNVNGVRYLAHRVAWKLMTGSDPVAVIDHKNNDPTDNRWCNLQDITNKENVRKDKKYNCVYPPKYKGNRCTSWIARPRINGKRLYLGGFKTREEAVAAVEQLREENTCSV